MKLSVKFLRAPAALAALVWSAACHRSHTAPVVDPGVAQRATIARYAHWHATLYDALASGPPRPTFEQKYRSGYVPFDLAAYVREELARVQRAAASLPDPPNVNAATLSLTPCSVSPPYLLAGTPIGPASSTSVCVAPLLVTSLFLEAGNTEWLSLRQLLIVEGLDPRTFKGEFSDNRIRNRTQADWNAVLARYQPIVDRFRGALDFVLAHQLARLAIPPGMAPEAGDRFRDSLAVAIVRKLNGSVGVGVVSATLQAAPEGIAPEAWGYESGGDASDVSRRFAGLVSSVSPPDLGSVWSADFRRSDRNGR